eukprot:764054-Hanusia_phi.AAC.5
MPPYPRRGKDAIVAHQITTRPYKATRFPCQKDHPNLQKLSENTRSRPDLRERQTTPTLSYSASESTVTPFVGALDSPRARARVSFTFFLLKELQTGGPWCRGP